jgi:hypothetical protein
MDSTVMGVIIGIAVAVGVSIAMARQRGKSEALATRVEPLLRERGPLTLPAIAEALGMGGFSGRGKVVFALNELQAQGKVEVIPAPEGTPQLQKVNFIQYRLKAGAGAP